MPRTMLSATDTPGVVLFERQYQNHQQGKKPVWKRESHALISTQMAEAFVDEVGCGHPHILAYMHAKVRVGA